MTMAQTSLLAYYSIENLGDKQRRVYKQIEKIQPCSNYQIAQALGWEINRVTGRVNELMRMGMIKLHKYGKNQSGRLVKLWEITE